MKIRNVLSMFMLAVAMLFAVGCGDDSAVVEKWGEAMLDGDVDTPTAVVEKWAEAMLDGDVEEACEYCTGLDPKEIKALLVFTVFDIENDDDAKKRDGRNNGRNCYLGRENQR